VCNDPRMPDAACNPPDLGRFLARDGTVQRVRLAAYAWCVDGDRVLLCRIADGGPANGRWTLPGGGLDFGEDPHDGALRELREETGLEARLGPPVAIRSAVLGPAETISGHRIHAVGILYRATVTGGVLRNEPDGSTDLARWIPRADIAQLPVADLLSWAIGAIDAIDATGGDPTRV
jgi:8-oxo-dGTP diphosphatase